MEGGGPAFEAGSFAERRLDVGKAMAALAGRSARKKESSHAVLSDEVGASLYLIWKPW